MSDTCRSCGSPIRWVMSEKGHRIPLDPDPVENGNLVPYTIPTTGTFGVPTIRARVADPGSVTPAWVSHFATCPNAARHRKGRR